MFLFDASMQVEGKKGNERAAALERGKAGAPGERVEEPGQKRDARLGAGEVAKPRERMAGAIAGLLEGNTLTREQTVKVLDGLLNDPQYAESVKRLLISEGEKVVGPNATEKEKLDAGRDKTLKQTTGMRDDETLKGFLIGAAGNTTTRVVERTESGQWLNTQEEARKAILEILREVSQTNQEQGDRIREFIRKEGNGKMLDGIEIVANGAKGTTKERLKEILIKEAK